MDEFSNVVSYDLAKRLNNKLYADEKYAGENGVEVTWDNYLGTNFYKEGEFIDDGDNLHGKYYCAPYNADVIDWLKTNYNIVIELIPTFTYALITNVGYYYKVFKIDKDNGQLTLLFEDNEWFSSLEFALNIITKKLVEEKFIEL